MLIKIVIGVVVVVGVFAVIVAMRPSDFRVERSAVVAAPAPVVFMAKAFCMFMSMDKMVGGEFEKGLAQMKSVAESANKT